MNSQSERMMRRWREQHSPKVDPAARYFEANWHFKQVAKAKADMKEHCAKVAEKYESIYGFLVPREIAAAIRAIEP